MTKAMEENDKGLRERAEAYVDASADGAITPEVEAAGAEAYEVNLTM